MTEAGWLAATPEAMLSFLEGKASERKLRLLACAWCRQAWHSLPRQACRDAVEVAERYADGGADRGHLYAANRLAWEAARISRGPAAGPAIAAGHASDALVNPVAAGYCVGTSRGMRSGLCVDLFGPLPFRPVRVNAEILAWHDAAVVRLARAAYEERQLPDGTLDEGRLAVLADALEEAGCDDPDILGHLRGSGPHVRGCFVLDLLLEKR